MKNLEQLNIYSLNVEMLDELILKVEKSKFENEEGPVNIVFSRLLRSIEIRPTTFIHQLRRRKSMKLREALDIYDRIFRLFLEIYDKTNDARYLNCVLKLNDNRTSNFGVAGRLYSLISSERLDNKENRKSIKDYLTQIEKSNNKQHVNVTSRFIDDAQIDKFMLNEILDYSGEEVVIFSPNIRSLYTLCVAEILRRNGIKVNSFVVKRILSISRIKGEIQRDGISWVYKKFIQRFLFRNYSERILSTKSLAHLARRLNVGDHDVASWARMHGASVVFTNDFNSPKVEDILRSLSIDLAVFTGGGLIRKNILELFCRGIINCHGGILPSYRGLDVEKWPIIENQPSNLGCCAHLMSEGVDEGPILIQYLSGTLPTIDIDELGLNLEYPQCTVLSYAVLHYIRGVLDPLPQKTTDGRQFYYMHPELLSIVRHRLSLQNP
jgi:methionyl-tRNA formyltransferase